MPCAGPGFKPRRRHPRKSSKNLQNLRKPVVRETRRPVYWSLWLVYWSSVQFTAFSVQFTAFPSSILDAVRRLVCSFPLSSILKCCLEPLLCLFASGLAGDSNQGSRRCKSGFLTSRAYLRLPNRVLCFDRVAPGVQYTGYPVYWTKNPVYWTLAQFVVRRTSLLFRRCLGSVVRRLLALF